MERILIFYKLVEILNFSHTLIQSSHITIFSLCINKSNLLLHFFAYRKIFTFSSPSFPLFSVFGRNFVGLVNPLIWQITNKEGQPTNVLFWIKGCVNYLIVFITLVDMKTTIPTVDLIILSLMCISMHIWLYETVNSLHPS